MDDRAETVVRLIELGIVAGVGYGVYTAFLTLLV